jgi:signal peptidase II
MKKFSKISIIIILIVALDQITKFIIIKYVNPFDSIAVFPFLNIVNVTNIGAAFGSFKHLGSNFFIVVSLIAIAFILYLLKKNLYNYIGLSLILGGALGNLIDRVFYGKVVDFIDFYIGNYHWPAFNVADSSLTIGIIVILFTSILPKKTKLS